MAKAPSDTGASRRHPVEPDFPSDAFAGTADYYARYRVPYPAELLDCLRAAAAPSGAGRLLDLACGTGQVALPLAPVFREVWALDREPEMIAVGRRLAAERGHANIRWLTDRAEDLAAPAAAFELVTVGSAFHRLHRRLVGRKAMQWLAPGRVFAVLGSNSLWTGEEDWQAIARDVVRRWVPQDATSAPTPLSGDAETFDEALHRAGLEPLSRHEFAVPQTWSLDSLLGYLYSLSGVSKRVLGDAADSFEADLRKTLLAHDPGGAFSETVRFHLILSRRPPT